MSDATLLPLDQPRVVVINDRGITFICRCRRVSEADWFKHFSAIMNCTEGKEYVYEPRTAFQMLAEDVIESVEVSRAGAAPTSVPNWKRKLTPGHKRAIAAELRDVNVFPDDSETGWTSDTNDVRLECFWSGNMQKYSRLMHRFEPPSIDQLREFNEKSSRTRVIGGAKVGKTVWPCTEKLLAKLYDELIVSVEGYSFSGTPLADQRDTIKREMDTFHKVSAVGSLFIGAGREQAEGEDQG